MAKNTKAVENLFGSFESVKKEEPKVAVPVAEVKTPKEEKINKKPMPVSPGRPAKNGKTKKLCLAIKAEDYDMIKLAASVIADGNTTAYLNKLIERDLKENSDMYKKMSELKK